VPFKCKNGLSNPKQLPILLLPIHPRHNLALKQMRGGYSSEIKLLRHSSSIRFSYELELDFAKKMLSRKQRRSKAWSQNLNAHITNLILRSNLGM